MRSEDRKPASAWAATFRNRWTSLFAIVRRRKLLAIVVFSNDFLNRNAIHAGGRSPHERQRVCDAQRCRGSLFSFESGLGSGCSPQAKQDNASGKEKKFFFVCSSYASRGPGRRGGRVLRRNDLAGSAGNDQSRALKGRCAGAAARVSFGAVLGAVPACLAPRGEAREQPDRPARGPQLELARSQLPIFADSCALAARIRRKLLVRQICVFFFSLFLKSFKSMDALAMALHCVHSTDSFSAALLKIVNMRGDSDSTGAVCGQIAGAM